MKKIVFGLILSVFSTSILAGDGGNCYEKYNNKFTERGANKVNDGWYENVVITFRQGNEADCFLGKVQVEKEEVTQMYLKNEDGTYQIFNRKWKHEEKTTISNDPLSTAKCRGVDPSSSLALGLAPLESSNFTISVLLS